MGTLSTMSASALVAARDSDDAAGCVVPASRIAAAAAAAAAVDNGYATMLGVSLWFINVAIT